MSAGTRLNDGIAWATEGAASANTTAVHAAVKIAFIVRYFQIAVCYDSLVPNAKGSLPLHRHRKNADFG
jgi:hypothetical protein